MAGTTSLARGIAEDSTMKRTSTYPLRLPASLKAAVAEISRAEGTSMNQFVAMAVEKTSAMRTAEFFAGGATRGTWRRPCASSGAREASNRMTPTR